ncbi:P-loop NTPase fold protein [uncultured Treponema sp.]|uniref:KAP family P-loop NTPase fold protein n=1 Tax=uncultured Treponema sp. TaxID=162155 RepID=UPI0025E803C4|nr:P-loop NTPase fold protein [uncultured Treponema sp.]
MIRIDYLSRQPFINLLKNIIANESKNKNGFSIAIDGDWGSGKTWILDMLESQLPSDEYLIFHYNAWENDFYEEPLVALLSVMLESLRQIKKVKEIGGKANVVSSSILTLSKIVGVLTEKKLGVNLSDTFDAIKNTNAALHDAALTDDDFNTLLPLSNALKQVRKVLSELNPDFKILLVVDELDRCLPEYAIKVLERLHHVCNKMPVFQIIAIDKSNLADSICKVFGKNFSNPSPQHNTMQFADSYLQKFIDISVPLSNGKPNKSLEVMNGLEKGFCEWTRKDVPVAPINFDENFLEEFLAEMFNGIDRRLQEKIFSQVDLCHKMTLATGEKSECCSYAVLIYEIVSCIASYVFHSKNLCTVKNDSNGTFTLVFKDVDFSANPYADKYKQLAENLKDFFCLNKTYYTSLYIKSDVFFIRDEKSYLMKLLADEENIYNDYGQKTYFNFIAEDKAFLSEYDKIMHTMLFNS